MKELLVMRSSSVTKGCLEEEKKSKLDHGMQRTCLSNDYHYKKSPSQVSEKSPVFPSKD